jgi:hypothetical protein
MVKWSRKRLIMGLATAVVLAVGTLLILQNIVPAVPVVIELSGTPGQKVKGVFVVDGSQQHEFAELPAKFSFQAGRLIYAIVPLRDEPAHLVTVKTRVDGKETTASCTAPAVKGAITGNSLLRLIRYNESMGGMNPAEIAQAR